MAVQTGIGIQLGGGGFTLGLEQNVFTGADRTAAEAARELYDGNNPGWIETYDANTSLNIRLEYSDGGDEVVLFQVRNTAGTAWLDNSSATGVQGDSGPAGATGNSYFFTAIGTVGSGDLGTRDGFFSDGTNTQLLRTNLPVVVKDGEASTAFFWNGLDEPVTYDIGNWRLSPWRVSTGSLLLGESEASIQNGGRVINANTAYGDLGFAVGVLADVSLGFSAPIAYSSAAASTVAINTDSGTTISDGDSALDLAFPAAIAATYNTGFVIIPITSGSLRVRSWIGVDDTGDILIDQLFNILPGDVGNQTTLTSLNRTMSNIGDQQFVRFSGIDLDGAIQSSGLFMGQLSPFLSSTFFSATIRQGLLGPTAAVVDNALLTFDGTGGSDTQSVNNASLTDSGTIVNLNVNSPIASTGTSGFSVSNSLGALKGELEYIESSDTVELLTTTAQLTLGQGPGAGTVEILGNDTEFLYQTGGTDNAFTIDMGSSPDTNPPLIITTGGPNGITVSFFQSDRDPNGNISGVGPDVCIRGGDTSSRIYQNRTFGSTTWTELGNVTTTQFGADNSMVVSNGSLQAIDIFDPVTVEQTGTTAFINIKSASASGTASGIQLTDTSDAVLSQFVYNENAGTTDITDNSASGIRIFCDDGDVKFNANAASGSMILELENPNATAVCGIVLENNIGGNLIEFTYNQNLDISTLRDTSGAGLDINSEALMQLRGMEAVNITSGTADSVFINSLFEFGQSSANSILTITSPNATGNAGTTYRNSSDDRVFRMRYQGTTDIASIETFIDTTQLLITSEEQPVNIDIQITDANPILRLTNTENGFDIFSRSNDPQGQVTGTHGDIVVAGNGINNTAIYLQRESTSSTIWGQVELLQKQFTFVNSTSTLSLTHNRIIVDNTSDIVLTLPANASNSRSEGFEQTITKNISNDDVITIDTPGFYGHTGNFVMSQRGDTVSYLQTASANVILYTTRSVIAAMTRPLSAGETTINGFTGADIDLTIFTMDVESYEGLAESDQANDLIVFPDVENLSAGDQYLATLTVVVRWSNNEEINFSLFVDDSGIVTQYPLLMKAQSTAIADEVTMHGRVLIRTGTNDTISLDTSVNASFTLATGASAIFGAAIFTVEKIEGK